MPTNLTPAQDLLAVVREFLEAAILRDAALSDDKLFNLRVAVNLLAAVERELRLGPVANADEAKRLTALTGVESSIEENDRRLTRAIRDGAVPSDDPQLFEHLHKTIVDSLRINNPKWLDHTQLP
jgi:hypothetical protein